MHNFYIGKSLYMHTDTVCKFCAIIILIERVSSFNKSDISEDHGKMVHLKLQRFLCRNILQLSKCFTNSERHRNILQLSKCFTTRKTESLCLIPTRSLTHTSRYNISKCTVLKCHHHLRTQCFFLQGFVFLRRASFWSWFEISLLWAESYMFDK